MMGVTAMFEALFVAASDPAEAAAFLRDTLGVTVKAGNAPSCVPRTGFGSA